MFRLTGGFLSTSAKLVKMRTICAAIHVPKACVSNQKGVDHCRLFVQVFFKLLDLIRNGADWSLADVQFVRDGMAGGANLSLLARSCGWCYSSHEKLVRRIKAWRTGYPQAAGVWSACRHCGQDGGRHPDKPTSVLGRFGRQVRVLALHDSTQVVRSGLPHIKALQDAEVQDGPS